jgi:hypothetical protein
MNRLWPFAVMLSVLAAAGCAGTGLFQREDVSRGQIFGPFRSSASRLDLTPQSAARPTKKDVLLIASVYDAEGKPLKRQSVEWTIDGPGEFVTVDDGGWFTARGKKKDGKFVTTTTHTFSEKLSRTNRPSSRGRPGSSSVRQSKGGRSSRRSARTSPIARKAGPWPRSSGAMPKSVSRARPWYRPAANLP